MPNSDDNIELSFVVVMPRIMIDSRQREVGVKASRSLSRNRRHIFVLVLFGAFGFLGTAIWLTLQKGLMPAPAHSVTPETDSARTTPPADAKAEKPNVEPPPLAPPPNREPAPVRPITVTDADLDYIVARNLLIPVAGVTAGQLHDTFNQARSEGRQHDAIDIVASQGTPVLATTDGLVIKLFLSDRGGLTLYELDPSGRYVYYYAHLMRYADSIAAGKPLRRGDVIAYVGDTGNASAGNYHLHFAISKIASPRQWSGGDAINPYPLLVHK
jgi:murein DD-endopeptidase MepM/ murein hydrolase activator NlpD